MVTVRTGGSSTGGRRRRVRAGGPGGGRQDGESGRHRASRGTPRRHSQDHRERAGGQVHLGHQSEPGAEESGDGRPVADVGLGEHPRAGGAPARTRSATVLISSVQAPPAVGVLADQHVDAGVVRPDRAVPGQWIGSGPVRSPSSSSTPRPASPGTGRCVRPRSGWARRWSAVTRCGPVAPSSGDGGGRSSSGRRARRPVRRRRAPGGRSPQGCRSGPRPARPSSRSSPRVPSPPPRGRPPRCRPLGPEEGEELLGQVPRSRVSSALASVGFIRCRSFGDGGPAQACRVGDGDVDGLGVHRAGAEFVEAVQPGQQVRLAAQDRRVEEVCGERPPGAEDPRPARRGSGGRRPSSRLPRRDARRRSAPMEVSEFHDFVGEVVGAGAQFYPGVGHERVAVSPPIPGSRASSSARGTRGSSSPWLSR